MYIHRSAVIPKPLYSKLLADDRPMSSQSQKTQNYYQNY